MGHYDRLSQTENDRCISLTRPSLGLPVVLALNSWPNLCNSLQRVNFFESVAHTCVSAKIDKVSPEI